MSQAVLVFSDRSKQNRQVSCFHFQDFLRFKNKFNKLQNQKVWLGKDQGKRKKDKDYSDKDYSESSDWDSISIWQPFRGDMSESTDFNTDGREGETFVSTPSRPIAMDGRFETPGGEPDNLDTLLSPTGVQHAFSERLLSREDDDEEEVEETLQDTERIREVRLKDSLDVVEQGQEVFEHVKEQFNQESEQAQEVNDEDEFQDALESVSSTSPSSPSASATPLTLRESWRRKRRHFFILSEAGKPIYSLHGDEDELASLMAVMQAMVSYVADMDQGDSLGCMTLAGEGRIVFSARPPLILVAVSWGAESERQLRQQLGYLYNQILSVLTLNQMTKIFEKRKGFDLRRMLAGSERLLASFCTSMESDPSFLLSSVAVLPLAPSIRDSVSGAITSACSGGKSKKSSPGPPVVFAVLVADNQLITLARMKKYLLHPADLHIILNLVNSTESFKHSEAWIPICLPRFNPSGFMNAHVSYLSDDCSACLLLLTAERDSFFQLSEARKQIIESLEKSNSLSSISEALSRGRDSTATLGILEMRHFLYKAKPASQFTYPSPRPPYHREENMCRLWGLYLRLQEAMHSPSRPLKLQWRAEERESVLGWTTQGFELYAAFSPLVTKASAVEAVNKLLKWCKREENSIFILNGPTF